MTIESKNRDYQIEKLSLSSIVTVIFARETDKLDEKPDLSLLYIGQNTCHIDTNDRHTIS